MMIWTAMVLLMGAMQATAGYNGERESSCELDDVPVWTSFDPESIEGIWYPVYWSHLPAYFVNVSLTWYDYKYVGNDDDNDSTGLTTVVVGNSTVVYKNGLCASYVYDYKYDSSNPGKLVTDAKTFGPITVKHDLYILGVTDEVMAVYSKVVVNGSLDKDSSAVILAVRDDSQPPTLQPQLKTKLREFCEQEADCLNFFQEKKLNHSASCAA